MLDPEGRPTEAPLEGQAAPHPRPDETAPQPRPDEVVAGEPVPASEPIPASEPVPAGEHASSPPLEPSGTASNDPSQANDPLRSSDWPAVAYWSASRGYPLTPAPPATWTPEPPPPTWTRTYELPTARKVVSSGLQLAVASSVPIRRASIYIGLLALGAFGPAVLLLLLGIGRLATIPQTTETFSADPSLLFYEQPEIFGPLVFIYILAIFGLILLTAISVDAQAIAIAVLGGTASQRPLHLRESITRARQTFWRLAGTGFLVGLLSGVISLAIAIPFLRPFDSNFGITFIASMIATLAVVPFAFASTGIVLGDVGAMEALRRSVSLFRARPRIALVVVLFTLVTSAIQTFAFGSGLDVAIRVAEFLHIELDQGGSGLILATILVLAFIVAFGSLTFTIAAIVAAPQVSGFLGLTYYSGGLDRARAEAATKPARARWVTLPMLLSMVALAAVAGFGLPTIQEFQPRPASPVLALLRTQAEVHEEIVSPYGVPLVVEDAAGDHGPGAGNAGDILAADMAGLYAAPDWLLADVFPCEAAGVACGTDRDSSAFELGGYVFIQRMAAAPAQVPGGPHSEWGPILRLSGFAPATRFAGERFEGANHRFSTELDGERLRIRAYHYASGNWTEYSTPARSAWRGDHLVTIVPWEALPGDPEAWDAYASVRDLQAPGEDNIRGPEGSMNELAFDVVPWFEFLTFDFFADPLPSS